MTKQNTLVTTKTILEKLDIGMWFADNNDSCCYQSRFNIYENNARVHI